MNAMASGRPRSTLEDVTAELQGPAEIDAPRVQSLGAGSGAYLVRFDSAMVTILIDGLRQGRNGLMGDVEVRVGPFGDGGMRHLTAGRIELNSMSQRETWERRLRKRWSGTDWDQVMDRFCGAIWQAEKRVDKPAILLRDAERPPVTGMLLDPLVDALLPTIWYGDGGAFKSYLALAAALSIHAGFPLIGSAEPARTLRCLYVDFELDAWPHHERMRRLLGMDWDSPKESLPDLPYLDCRGSTINTQIERIQAAARDHRSEFVVIDSISYAAEGPLNDDETPRTYYRLLGSLGVPTLSLGHIAKNGSPDSPFGSVHWKNLARLAWYFHVAEKREGQTDIRLMNKKHTMGADAAPFGLTLAFQDGITRIMTTPQGAPLPPAAVSDRWERIAALLGRERRPMSYAEIALALGEKAELLRRPVAEHHETFEVLGTRQDKRVSLRQPPQAIQ
jgi:hypothetical protein